MSTFNENDLIDEQNDLDRDFAKQGGEMLTFYIEEQVYGILIKYVTDIIEFQPITYVPKVPDYINGVINLRGKVIPVMDVRKRFGKPLIEYNDRTCIVVTEVEDMVAGLIVDRVIEVASINGEDVTLPPNDKKVNSNKYIDYIVNCPEGVKFSLDVKKLLLD